MHWLIKAAISDRHHLPHHHHTMPLQVVGYVAIGFPLGGMANLVLRSRAHWSELELSPVPKLVLQGTRDSYSPLSTLRDLMMQYNEHEPTPGPMELKVGGPSDLVCAHLYLYLRQCWKALQGCFKAAGRGCL
jgi:hypothetical protein